MEVEKGTQGVAQAVAGYGEILSAEALELARMYQELPEQRRQHLRATVALESVLTELLGQRAIHIRQTEFRDEYRKRLLKAIHAAKGENR